MVSKVGEIDLKINDTKNAKVINLFAPDNVTNVIVADKQPAEFTKDSEIVLNRVILNKYSL